MSRRKIIIIVTLAVVCLVGGYYTLTYFRASTKIKNYRKRLEANLAAMRQKQYAIPPLFGTARGGDGGPELLAAVKEAAKLAGPELFHELPKLLAETPDEAAIEKARPFLKLSRPLLDRVYTALKMEKTRVPFDFKAHDSMPSPLVFRTLGIAMIMRGRELKESREYSEALRWFFAAARYGQDISRQAPLRYREAGAETTVDALREAFRMLYKKDFGLGDLKRFLKWAQALEASEPGFGDNLLAEQYLGECRLLKISENIGFFPASAEMPGTGRKSFTILAWTADSWGEFLKWYETAHAGADNPYPGAHELLTGHIGERILGDETVRGLTWDFEKIHSAHTLSLTFCRAMRFMFWLRVFNAKNGRYPRESIEELADGLPADPFTDNRKFYYQHSYGETKFYSVGSDANNNNGNGRKWENKTGQDIIFPATPLLRIWRRY